VNKDFNEKFLIDLINEPGPSGYEDGVQKIWQKEVMFRKFGKKK